MTKAEFLKWLQISPEPYLYSGFSSIPKDIRDPEVIERWLEHTVKKCSGGSDHAFSEIPANLVTDSIRYKAIELGVRALHYIKPEDTQAYLDLVVYAAGISNFGILMIHESFKTTETLQAIVDRAPQNLDLQWNSQQWICELLTQEMIDKVAPQNFKFAFSLPDETASWEVQRQHIITDHKTLKDLQQRGRQDLLIRLLDEGGWPEWTGFTPQRADTIGFAAARLMIADPESDELILYRAKLMSYPIKEVIGVMNTPARRKVLMELYSPEVIRQNMKHDRALRGAVLEQDLGL